MTKKNIDRMPEGEPIVSDIMPEGDPIVSENMPEGDEDGTYIPYHEVTIGRFVGGVYCNRESFEVDRYRYERFVKEVLPRLLLDSEDMVYDVRIRRLYRYIEKEV